MTMNESGGPPDRDATAPADPGGDELSNTSEQGASTDDEQTGQAGAGGLIPSPPD